MTQSFCTVLLFSSLGFSALAAGDVKKFEIDIQSQSAGKSLLTLARSTGVQIMLQEGPASKVQLPALKGTYSLEEALIALLGDVELEYEFTSVNRVVVKSAKAASKGKEAAPLEEVIVTGTRLKHHNPALPIITFVRADLDRGGYSSLADVFRRLPQNLNSLSAASIEAGEAEFGEDRTLSDSSLGLSSVNLRGIGTRGTLILINGRRRAASAQGVGNYTDISSIPLSQVESINIVTDGASAIYGADAVGGVVDIILRKDYQGGQFQARHEDSGSGANLSRINGAYTFNWGEGYLSASADISKSKSADTSSFIYSGPNGIGDFTDKGGVNTRKIGFGQPGSVYEVDPFRPFMPFEGDFIGLIPEGQDGSSLQESDLIVGDPNARQIYENPAIGPKVNAKSLRLNGEQELGDSLNLGFEVSYSKLENTGFWEPTLFEFNSLAFFARNMTLIPEENPYNHFGRDVLVAYSYANEFAQMGESQDERQENYNLMLDLTGELPMVEGWDFTLNYAYSKEKGKSDYLFDATGTFGDGDKDPALRVLPVLLQLNPFGDGSDPATVANNAALLSSWIERNFNDAVSDSHSMELSVNGTLLSLPAGDVQMVVGANLRREKVSSIIQSEDAPNQDPYPYRRGNEREVTAYFVEMGIPLLADKPFAKELDLTLAARYEKIDQQGTSRLSNGLYELDDDLYQAGAGYPDYYVPWGDVGDFNLGEFVGLAEAGSIFTNGPDTAVDRTFSSTTPQVSLNWRPVDDLRVRATWGESFLTPQSQQLYGNVRAFDGLYSWTSLEGLPLPDGVNRVAWLSGPNSNLEPQDAETWTVGFDYTPMALPGLVVKATYSEVEFDNYISTPYANIGLSVLAENLEMFPEIFNIDYPNLLIFDSREQNLAKRTSRTVDIDIDYTLDSDIGGWYFALNAARTLETSQQANKTAGKQVFSETERGPSKWAANFTVGWDYGNYDVTLVTNYTSSHKVANPLSARGTIYNDFTPNLNPQTRSHGTTTFDLQVGYTADAASGWLQGTKMQLGAQNLFDADPEFVDSKLGYATNRLDVRGRVIYLDLQKQFAL
ncbi:TonB-dependent receptor [Porticoccaceae bacterium LTM1]|nr:TonB-dependent receptor [Porticoccaceae bacterium LTM1]